MKAIVEEAIGMLGCHVRDKVTGVEGVIISTSFDLNGCVQFVVQPGSKPDGSGWGESRWLDIQRVEIAGGRKVDLPEAFGVTGPTEKPPRDRR